MTEFIWVLRLIAIVIGLGLAAGVILASLFVGALYFNWRSSR